jgi:YD repeat-containing protein
MQNYTQQYQYDELGNILQMQSVGAWTRNYIYDTATNKLLRHSGTTDEYSYDAHGNMLSMPHLSAMTWDSKTSYTALPMEHLPLTLIMMRKETEQEK